MSVPLRSEESIVDYPTAPKNLRPTVSSSQRYRRLSSVTNLPVAQGYPAWLRVLIVGQRLSLVMVVSTLTVALVTYGLTVNVNRRLMLTTAKLGMLQTQQKQLTAANAVFKNHLAQVAMATLQGNTLNPRDVIFLETHEGAVSPASESSSPPTQLPVSTSRPYPKGY